MASMKPEKPDEESHGAGTSSQTTRNRGPFSAAAKVFSTSKFNVAASPFVMNSTKNEPNMRIEMSPRRSSMYAQMPPGVPYATSTPVAPQFRSILGRDPRAHHRHAVGPNLMDESIMCCFMVEIFFSLCRSIEMTLDRAVRVINSHSKVAVALSNTGNSSALIHPNGRVYQYGSKVEIITYDGMRKNNFVRYAKMWQKGVSFTSQHCALVYLVDTAGTRTTTDSFTDMSQDLTKALFYRETRYGEEFVDDVLQVLRAASWWSNEDGSDLFDVNGFRITQTPDGLVRITSSNNKCLIRTSPGNGSATLTTNFMHCTASMGQTSHLFVRRGELRMHFDGSQFVVRNAGHSAGFDDNNRLKVY
uniref:Uncharacterized protein n=1 Tax=Lutzomyia longipalpis TaxID=7200 RepID=A0A1B0CCM3_LUTLO